MDGVAAISVPALGAVGVGGRLRKAALNLIEGLLFKKTARAAVAGAGRGGMWRACLRELGSPLGADQVRGDNVIRFSTAVVRGNLRLLLGMVRANRSGPRRDPPLTGDGRRAGDRRLRARIVQYLAAGGEHGVAPSARADAAHAARGLRHLDRGARPLGAEFRGRRPRTSGAVQRRDDADDRARRADALRSAFS